ncbi:MAG: acetylornithine deacetylase/succinyl-diaminopimelate desuccinylase family protein [Alphaproteobacteria bacterium]
MTVDIAEQVLRRVESLADDVAALTLDLVAMPTLNPPGEGYLGCCEYLARRLKRTGFETELVRALGAPGDSDVHPRWNVVARRAGARAGQCVHFNSHIDVVQVGAGWTTNPFGERRGGRIYGRGTCDMKGGLAASIIAAEAFIAACPDYDGAIEISGTADEESGGFGGVAYLAEHGYFDPARVHHVIIPEPLNKDRICLGHRGVFWAEIETFGRIAHGSMPFLGDCAVRHMGAVIRKMEEQLFPALAQKRTDMPVVPEGAKHSTMNINAIHGGEPEQAADYTGLPAACVPDSCRMVVDRRYLIEEDPNEVREELVEMLEAVQAERQGFRYALRDILQVPPTMTDREAPVVQSVARSVEFVLGVTPQYVVSPGTYDQKHIDRIGKLKNCIAYGPGILDLAHQPDEYVDVADMVDSAQVMALTLVDLLTAGRRP